MAFKLRFFLNERLNYFPFNVEEFTSTKLLTLGNQSLFIELHNLFLGLF